MMMMVTQTAKRWLSLYETPTTIHTGERFKNEREMNVLLW